MLLDYLSLVLRFALGLAFIVSGVAIFQPQLQFVQFIDTSGFFEFGTMTRQYWAFGLGIITAVAGFILLIGMSTRTAAVALIAVLMAVAVLSFNFWDYDWEVDGLVQSFAQNLVASIALVYILVRGAGPFSIDNS